MNQDNSYLQNKMELLQWSEKQIPAIIYCHSQENLGPVLSHWHKEIEISCLFSGSCSFCIEGKQKIMGAKTGTAQKLPRKDGKYLLSYIGYAPQENPEVVIYVVIDEANVDAQDNSSLVLELAKNIMSEAFPYLGITTIEETGESQTQQSGQSFEDTEYSDYDQDYTDDYSNEDGSYIDENYKPDLDSWATSSNTD